MSRLRPRIERTVARPHREPNPDRSPAYLAKIRQLACVITGRWPTEAHHLLGIDLGHGMGKRAADRWAIPLAPEMHREAHAAGNDEEWLAARGINGRDLARALWTARESLEGMNRVAERHLTLGRQKRGEPTL